MSDAAKIGPTFADELKAAGIPLDGISWDPAAGTIIACPDALKAQVSAVLAAHNPTKPLTQDVPDISDRQFARGLWGDGIITYADFLGFIGPGTIPTPIQAIVEQLPDDDTGQPTARKDAIGFLTGSKLYSFSHPLVEFFRQALVKDDPKWTVDYLRQQWLLWATL